jgi:sterol desaturase/sphingolipid hydroxylase (fatty acid hydroxylase superfamily)
MNSSWLVEHYDWLASLVSLLSIIAVSLVGKYLAFKVPDLQRMRELNRQHDRQKLAQSKYPPVVAANRKVGLACNLTFFIVILPFCATLESQPAWKILLDIIAILMFYDFIYYLSHRFWFHGKGWMRQLHALHHQARNPTHIDAHYVHPFETFIGISLYVATVAALAALLGPFNAATIVVTFVVFVQVNTINHTYIDLPRFPFKTLTWITAKHHRHHENMQMGNYATITLLYDRMFGTFE